MISAFAFVLIAFMRIISLAPSLTEDLYTIGAGPRMVGADTYSNRPAAAERLPRVGALLGISAERVLSLQPTLVVGLRSQEPILAQLRREGVGTLSFGGDSLADDFATIHALGIASNRERSADFIVAKIRRRLAHLQTEAALEPVVSAFAVVGTTPIYTCGQGAYLCELLRMAGLEPIGARTAQPWFAYSAESLESIQPRTLVTSSESNLPETPPWSRLRAVRESCVIRIDADLLFRPGPHVADLLQSLITARRELPHRCLTLRSRLRSSSADNHQPHAPKRWS